MRKREGKGRWWVGLGHEAVRGEEAEERVEAFRDRLDQRDGDFTNIPQALTWATVVQEEGRREDKQGERDQPH